MTTYQPDLSDTARLTETYETLKAYQHYEELTRVEPDPDRLARSVAEYMRLGRDIRIHFGCGPRILKDWINIDLTYQPFTDRVGYYTDRFYPKSMRGTAEDFFALDVTAEPLPIPDNTVSVIFHEDFLEHLDQRGQMIFLAETRRVLKNGGIHRVNTPCLKKAMNMRSNMDAGFKGVDRTEWDVLNHRNLLTENSLRDMAETTGYAKTLFNGRDQSRAAALLPPEFRPAGDRTDSDNLFADLVKWNKP